MLDFFVLLGRKKNGIYLVLFLKELLSFSQDVFQFSQLKKVFLQSLCILIDLEYKTRLWVKFRGWGRGGGMAPSVQILSKCYVFITIS